MTRILERLPIDMPEPQGLPHVPDADSPLDPSPSPIATVIGWMVLVAAITIALLVVAIA